MTTLTRTRSSDAVPGPPAPAPHKDSRLARWRASWRVALRMAVRDVRRYRGRSILVFVMVAVPVGILASLTTVAASGAVDNLDRAPLSLGPAQALLTGPNPEPVIQGPDPDLYQASAGGANAATATPIPGFDVAQSLGSDANVAALARLTGGTIERVGSIEMRHRMATTTGTGTRSRSAQVMVFDAASRDWGAKATLTSGRWASGPTEVVVTPYGISRGIPSSGTTTLVSQGKDYPVTVVGVANVFNGWGGQPDAVTPEPVASDALHSWQWLLLRDQGVPYSEVRQLNGYGLAVVSVEALRHPPSGAELPAEVRQVSDFQSGELRLIVGLGGVMLFLVVTLLVAPAFAVSAARQRRTLALAASNGAETRQLRRTVLAQALVLGAASAVAATALGALLVGAGIAAWARYRPWSTFRYFDVSVPALVAIAGFAVVSAIIAALVPAARLGRLDIVGVMRGQSVSPALNRTLPVAGIILAVAGGTGLLWSVRTEQHELPVALSGIALTLGALLLVPLLLVLAGRLARRLPVTPRMATRDAARHRGRSGPTVAAIMAGTVALTIFSVALASDTEQRRREYQPQLAVGEGYVYVNSTQVNPVTGQPDKPDYTVVTTALGQVTPHLSTTPLLVTQPSGLGGNPGELTPFVAVVPPGCPLMQAVYMDNSGGPNPVNCQRLGSMAMATIGVLSIDEITRVAHLSDSERTLVERGGLVVRDADLAPGGRVTAATGLMRFDEQTGAAVTKDLRTTTLSAVVRDPKMSGMNLGGLVTPETAQRHGWPTTQQSMLIRDADGPISVEDQEKLGELLGDDGGVYVERGFQRDDIWPMRILFGGFGFLLLVVTLISTSLSLAEQQSDMGTFAAVGATRRTRRSLAAAQAMVVGLIGALLGIAVGLVPGIAMSYPLTTLSWDPMTGEQVRADPITVIPWLPLALIVIGVPLLAGLLSAAAVRRAPAMTRRAD